MTRTALPRLRTGTVVIVLAALLALPGSPGAPSAPTADTAAAAAAAGGSLRVTPRVHVGGQALHFRGSIGASGRRTVHLQSHLGRAGDTWQDVPRSATRTDPRGRFDLVFPAPSTFKVRYRVAGGGRTTRAVLLRARPQEVVLRLAGRRTLDPPFHRVRPGRPFTVVVDTTAAVRTELGVAPAVPGRAVTLQERVDGHHWRSIGSGRTDRRGLVSFRLTAPEEGTRVLRARQERWTRGQNAIGWLASFPTYFSTERIRTGTTAREPDPAGASRSPASRGRLRPFAGQRYDWGPLIYDFAWDRGQDLGTPPSRGTRLRGGWVDTSDGTGRATQFNGGLFLQSRLVHGGRGDLGTTTATLRGNAQAVGRWEFRLQEHVWERAGRPYRFRLELVPEGAEVAGCSPESILVAGFTLGSSRLQVGARSQQAGSVWRRTVRGVRPIARPVNVAVEVSRRHVTWFLDSRPVATTRDQRVRPDAPLAPRLSLVGGPREMAGAQIDSDWQRAWALAGGRQVRSGPGLARSPYRESC